MIELAGEPRAKGRPRFTKTGRAFTPAKTVSYEGQLAMAAQIAMEGRALFEGPLCVDMAVFMPVAKSWSKKRRAAALSNIERPTRKPDFDNFAKMLDAFNGVVWLDDSQVVDGTVCKFYSDRPRMVVRVKETPISSAPPLWAQPVSEKGIFA